MKRAGRWLFNFAAAVSLMMCVLTPLILVPLTRYDAGPNNTGLYVRGSRIYPMQLLFAEILVAVTMGAFGVLPALWWRRDVRERNRISAGLCANCGYDLRATPDRCPECGAIPPAAKEAAA